MDVLDGWVAREASGSSREGLLLDRAIDRFSQVVVPFTIYIISFHDAYRGVELAILLLYFSILSTTAFYRLVYRIVWSLEYFAGLPLFIHSVVMISSVIAGSPLPPQLLLALALATAAPIPYMRRLRTKQGGPSPAPLPRLLLLAVLAAVPYNNTIVLWLARLLLVASIAYAALGYIPPLLAHKREYSTAQCSCTHTE
jgi:CDP-diacylglycerol--serine O-phosphatidyltransferase